MTTVVLHMGIPKTGTSALQTAFVQQRDTLAAHGVTYPAARNDRPAQAGQATGGNGVQLLPHLAGDVPDETVLAAFREQVEGAGEFVLYSSEAMWRARLPRLDELVAEAEQAGAAVRAVVCLRNVADHAASSYAQNLAKGIMGGQSFSDFVAGKSGPPRYRPQLRRRLEHLDGLVDLRVLHFDSVRDRLLEAVTEAAFGRRVPLVEPPRVNDRPERIVPSDSDRAALARLMAADVEWVNDRFLGGALSL